tara:strand:+ start:41689 stop:43029 length:1341 start_codon:yes stop_codon:yes gene_type:complete
MHIILKANLCFILISSFFLSFCLATEKVEANPVRSISQSAYIALESHPKILISRNDIYSSQQQLTKVESALLPSVSLSLGIGREDSNNSSTKVKAGFSSLDMERRESAITLSQMIFDGFNADNLRRSQLEKITAEEADYFNLASEVALKAIETHLDVATKNKILNDHLANLKVHEQIAKDIGLRVRSGKDNRARVSQISARLSLALANLETAKTQVLSANVDYLRDVGEMPSRQLNSLGQLFKMPETESGFLEVVIRDNPFLDSKTKEINAQKFVEKASQSSRLPNVYFESGASWNDNLDGVSGRNSDAFIMLRMRYNLYKGGSDRAEERLAKYQAQSLRYELDDLRREFKREASRAWFSYQSNAKRVSFLQDYVESAQTTKIAYAQQFNIGQRSLIDLLDAENELLKAKGQLHEAQQALSLSKYQILHLQGKLLSTLSLDSLVVM